MTTRKRTQATLDLIEFLRPGPSYWPYPYAVEQAFELLRWMIATGESYEDHGRWGRRGVRELLSGGGYACGFSQVTPIRGLEDLRLRFHHAVLGEAATPAVARWREEQGIHAYGKVVLPYRHYKPMKAIPELGLASERDQRELVANLLDTAPGTKLAASLNYVHKRARTIHRVDIGAGADGFRVWLHYGFNAMKPGQMDSEWTHLLAATEGRESFIDTAARAARELERVRTESFVNVPDWAA